MKTYERISQLEKLGLEIEEFKVHVPKKNLTRVKNIPIYIYSDSGEEYELPNREGILHIPEHYVNGHAWAPQRPKHYTNVAKKAKDRDVYLNILKLEGVDVSKLEDKIIYCRGHLIWLPDVSYYCRLPVSYYLKTAKTGLLPTH